MRVFAITAAAFIALGLLVWWELSLWPECRATNSFFYCARVLGK